MSKKDLIFKKKIVELKLGNDCPTVIFDPDTCEWSQQSREEI